MQETWIQSLGREDPPEKGKAQFSSVQSFSHVRLFATPWAATCQASLSITNSWSLLKLMSIASVMPSNHLILCHPLLLQPSTFPSIRVFLNESVLRIRWPKYWSFSFSISHSNEYSGLISFRMDWLDPLAVQGTLKSLLQYHSSKASIPLQYSGLENSMDCIVHGVAKSWTRLSDYHFHHLMYYTIYFKKNLFILIPAGLICCIQDLFNCACKLLVATCRI